MSCLLACCAPLSSSHAWTCTRAWSFSAEQRDMPDGIAAKEHRGTTPKSRKTAENNSTTTRRSGMTYRTMNKTTQNLGRQRIPGGLRQLITSSSASSSLSRVVWLKALLQWRGFPKAQNPRWRRPQNPRWRGPQKTWQACVCRTSIITKSPSDGLAWVFVAFFVSDSFLLVVFFCSALH